MNISRMNGKTSTSEKRHFSKLTSFVILGAILAALVAIGTFVFSETSNSVVASPKTVPTPNEKKYIATRRITVDPQTGQLRKPNAEELRELITTLKAMTTRTDDNLRGTSLTNGGQSLNLGSGFEGVVLSKPNEDGTSEIRCVFTFEEAAAFLGLEEEKGE